MEREKRSKRNKRRRFLKRSYAASCAKTFRRFAVLGRAFRTEYEYSNNHYLPIKQKRPKQFSPQNCECAPELPLLNRTVNQASLDETSYVSAGGMFKNQRFLNPSVCAMTHTSSRGRIDYNWGEQPAWLKFSLLLLKRSKISHQHSPQPLQYLLLSS